LTGALAIAGGKLEAATQTTLATLAAQVAESQVASDAATGAYATKLKKFVEVQKFVWPPDGSTFRNDKANMMRDETQKAWSGWLSGPTPNTTDIHFAIAPASSVVMTEIPEAAPPTPAPVSASAAPPPPPAVQSVPPKSVASGIRYREPARGKFLVCYDRPCAKGVDVAVAVDGSVPQLGRLYYLPFTNGAFQNNALSAAFAEDGTLLSAGYQEKSSRAEIASDTAKQIASALPQAVKDIRSARNDSLNAETDRMKAQTNYLSAQADYKKALAALSTSPTEARETERTLIQADTNLKDAYRANIEAKLALDKALEKIKGTTAP
jgi:hypothetical protein